MRRFPSFALARALGYLTIGMFVAARNSPQAAYVVGIVVCIALLIGWEAWRWRRRHPRRV